MLVTVLRITDQAGVDGIDGYLDGSIGIATGPRHVEALRRVHTTDVG